MTAAPNAPCAGKERRCCDDRAHSTDTRPARREALRYLRGSGTDWQRAAGTGETITALVVRGLIVRDARGHHGSRSRGASGAVAGAVMLRAAGVLTGARYVTGQILGGGRRKG
jgi:hypothetical protein